MNKKDFCPHIVEKLAEKYDLSKQVVENVIRSQFKFVANTMEAGHNDNVRLHYFGVLDIKINKLMGKSHEFITVQNLYDDDDLEEGKMRLIKKDMKLKWLCRDLDMITDVEQAYNDNGNIRIKYCKVYHRDIGSRVILGKYEETKRMILNNTGRINTLGFKKKE